MALDLYDLDIESDALRLVIGDTFSDDEQVALFAKIAVGGEVIASDASNGGWGHHSVEAVVKYADLFYVVNAGGCSCDGSASVAGPFLTREEAGYEELPLGDNYKDW